MELVREDLSNTHGKGYYATYILINGIKEGEYKIYDSHNALRLICYYISDNLEGKHVEYCILGGYAICNYYSNKKEGPRSYYCSRSGGNLPDLILNYKNDKIVTKKIVTKKNEKPSY